VSGTSTAFEPLETNFQQDLNGDGVIGIHASPTLGAAGVANSNPENQLVKAAPDTFVFAPNLGQTAIAHYNPEIETLQISQSIFADVTAALSITHDAKHDIEAAAAHDMIGTPRLPRVNCWRTKVTFILCNPKAGLSILDERIRSIKSA
jgi:hypothetical protein